MTHTHQPFSRSSPAVVASSTTAFARQRLLVPRPSCGSELWRSATGDAFEALDVVDELQAETLAIANNTLRELQVDPVDDLEASVVNSWTPLRELLVGMSLLQEQTVAATDTVLSFGERLSAEIIARIWTRAGVDAFCVDARECLLTDDAHGSANVLFNESKAKLLEQSKRWKPDALPVIKGSIGCTQKGRTTTLGRNGADYTATLVGAVLSAD
uniref:Aspartate/glutamate/uridylate kinase domain-containing protein n=1 Tax=Peronospora matthiolae TaxID=2874970 RepID=A0AAV1UBR6_9STRA